MRNNDELNMIPSFDSLSNLGQQPGFFSNQMKFICSKNNIQSFRQLEEDLPVIGNSYDLVEELSINHYQDERIDEEKQTLGTKECFKTPKKKSKTGCICKKTGCLMLYCECFSSGKTCTSQCSCCNCSNTIQNQHQIQTTRNFRKKKSRQSEDKKVCNCKKTKCQKKYCQCFNAGIACSQECKCDGCCNTDKCQQSQ